MNLPKDFFHRFYDRATVDLTEAIRVVIMSLLAPKKGFYGQGQGCRCREPSDVLEELCWFLNDNALEVFPIQALIWTMAYVCQRVTAEAD